MSANLDPNHIYQVAHASVIVVLVVVVVVVVVAAAAVDIVVEHTYRH
jgi:hypothetical protein